MGDLTTKFLPAIVSVRGRQVYLDERGAPVMPHAAARFDTAEAARAHAATYGAGWGPHAVEANVFDDDETTAEETGR